MDPAVVPYYRAHLALVHHLGFAFHADACAPGILSLLQPIRDRGGLVVELGCGSGLLTRHLVDAGHRVVATDASPAMLALARDHTSGAQEIGQLVLPDHPVPPADAIVSTGHALNYLPTEVALDQALIAAAQALRPGGVLALDLCDLGWGEARRGEPPLVRINHDWVLASRFSQPSPDRYVREMTVFVRAEDGSWHRDDERHDNVLIDTSRVPALLADYGVEARIAPSFGAEELSPGLVVVIGHRPT